MTINLTPRKCLGTDPPSGVPVGAWQGILPSPVRDPVAASS